MLPFVAPLWTAPPPRPAATQPVAERVRLMLAYARTLVGVTELPPGSNRGALPDAIAHAFGSPLGSSWCALLAGHLRQWAGLWVPPAEVGSCDAWAYYAKKAGRWTPAPADGAVVLYTHHAPLVTGPYARAGLLDAVHAGVVVDAHPQDGRAPRAIEGNTSAPPDTFEPNGGCVAEKEIDRRRVYGFVLA